MNDAWPSSNSLPALLRARAERTPDRIAYRFGGGRETPALTYGALQAAAERFARGVAERGLSGRPLALMLPTGPAFATAFFGALLAGSPVAPLAPSRSLRTLGRLRGIVEDLRPGAVVTTDDLRASVRQADDTCDFLATCDLLAVDELSYDGGRCDLASPHEIAVVQYTSGSTSEPKGVQVSHANLLANARLLTSWIGGSERDVTVSWLPLYHDMGLIGGIVAPLFAGGESILLETGSFLQDPATWLRTISRHAATVSLSATFGYDLCARRLRDEDLTDVDLRTWRTAICGAEPISPDVLERFCACLEPFGFDRKALMPSYGLAEATLFVTGAAPGDGARVLDINRTRLEVEGLAIVADPGDRVIHLTSCGLVNTEQQVLIVDPVRRTRHPEGVVGEVWITGGHVARGYWGRPDETRTTFAARLADEGTLEFLRTGDLGFIASGELVIVGRLKDIIIINGVNHHPHDLEQTAVSSHPALAGGLAAAFSVVAAGAEGAVIVLEVARGVEAGCHGEILQAVRRAVSEAHGVALRSAYLVRQGSIPRTTSGKVRRADMGQAYRTGNLNAIAEWSDTVGEIAPPVRDTAGQTATEALLLRVFHDILGTEPASLEADLFDTGPGLDSIGASRARHALSVALGRDVELTALFDHPTIAGLGIHLDETARMAPAADVRPPLPPVRPRPAAQRTDPFPLTDIQEAYWVGRDPGLPLGGVAAHAYREIRMRDLDIRRLELAVDTLVLRHDALRMIVDAEGRQQVLPEPDGYHIHETDFRGLPSAEVEGGLEAVRASMSHQVLVPDQWPLFELRISRVDADVSHLHVSLDLLISDVWSASRLADELAQLYLQPDLRLPPLGLTFRDYQMARALDRDGVGFERAQRYWRERLPDFARPVDLPVARSPNAMRRPRFTRLEHRIPAAAWDRFKGHARAAGVTPTAALLTAFAAVLSAWARQPAFTLTLTVSDRRPLHSDVGRLVGEFTNLVLLEVEPDPGQSFAQAARTVQRQLWQDLDHIAFGGMDVLRELNRVRGAPDFAGVPVVFTSTLAEQTDLQVEDALGRLGEPIAGISQTPQVWLDHQVFENGGELLLNWDFVAEIFPDGLIETAFAAYADLLRRLAERDDLWLSGPVPRLPQAATAVTGAIRVGAASGQGGLHHAFFDEADRAPERLALVCGERRFTYGDLKARARAIAVDLHRRHGVQCGDRVAIVMRKGWQQVVGVLAVLDAGGVYVPVSSDWPSDRVTDILQQAGVAVALVDRDSDPGAAWRFGVDLLEVGEATSAAPRRRLRAWRPDDLAYVIYTSGSTGRPKGVMMEHAAARNTVDDLLQRFAIGPLDRMLGVSALTFDLSVFDIFGPLSVGAALILPDATQDRDPACWLLLVAEHGVSIWNSAPALLDLFVEHVAARRQYLPSLRLVLASGDWIPLALPGAVKAVATGAAFVSLGGATEAAIWSIIRPVKDVSPGWRSIPYGKPLANQTVQVLDQHLEVRPVWAVGRLYIGGVGLARGYMGDPAATAARFIRHPRTGERLYWTGDLGRYLPDGDIEFLGREDRQVKLQGHRIELGEIETVLSNHPAVSAAVASVASGEGVLGERLVVYVTLGDHTATEATLRAHLTRQLPSYMVPSKIQILKALPLSENGKIDRRPEALGRPASPPAQHAARHPSEARILAIVRDALGDPSLEATDNLLRAGANSIHLIKISNILVREMEFSPKLGDVFEDPTVRMLAIAYEAWRAEGIALAAPAEILTSPEARTHVKHARRDRRAVRDRARALALPRSTEEALAHRFRTVRSTRRYDLVGMELAALGALLELLSEGDLHGAPKHLYPSAGGLYAVETFLLIKADRVEGAAGGLYHYDPVAHEIEAVAASTGIGPYVLPDNADMARDAPVLLMFVADLPAMTPLYGDDALRFCLLEAGAMAQTLTLAAADHGLGICHVGVLSFGEIRTRLGLGSGQALVAAMTLGGLRLEDRAGAVTGEREDSDDLETGLL